MGQNNENLRHKIVGDRRDQAAVVADEFGSEAKAAEWALGVLNDAGVDPASGVAAIGTLRKARPDLTLRTVEYVLHHANLRT